ncbi:hypothetical protein C3941_07115 [Kaistia algarum]|uniref:endonuclease/exonuclease/phosphatase family protein n=1 Tax=Kaistia algarum TaxID=2083279 RepID=UPI000CE8E5E7|nr:endonuclease/exonuclease/phosphatase family protein [Kaistia algarum]MCX5515554.1 endonuclease/exonuclease/phosphatase family protein [Kaistia algarum]PPE81047.1 hypothetical protein C3941_07115 [Kaistia algarum]
MNEADLKGVTGGVRSRSQPRGVVISHLLTMTRFGFDAIVLAALVCVVAGYFGATAWLLDMVTFFRPHVAALALGLLLLALLSRSRPRMVVGALVFAAAAYPLIVPSTPMADPAKIGNFRVLSTNIMGGDNADTEGYRRLVEAVTPDVVVAQEVVPEWRQTLKGLAGYPYFAGPEFRDGESSVMVASRYPIRASRLYWRDHPQQDAALGAIPLRVEILRPGAQRPLIVYAIHPPTPRSYVAWKARNVYLDEIAAHVADDLKGSDVIVVGDWNTPYWSPFFSKMLAKAGLRASEGAWPAPTRIFREFGAPDFLGSPIDHVEVSPSIGVVGLKIGDEFGSDHLPVIADLAVP